MKSYISPSRHWVVKSTGKSGTWTVERQDGTLTNPVFGGDDSRRIFGEKEWAQSFADARNEYERVRAWDDAGRPDA